MKLTREKRPSVSPLTWVLLAGLAVIAALLGGSSRPDAVQIIVLRPVAALFLIPCLLMLSRETLETVRTPLLLLLGLGLWMVIQIIPLPAGLWQALPGREPVEAIGAQLGMADIWRPISMVPSRTLNALASLIVPLAALLVFAASGGSRRTVLIAIAALGVANAALGILQVIGGTSQALYFYEITNFGSAVGFFANHNHSAVFCSIAMVVIAYLGAQPEYGLTKARQRAVLAFAFVLVLLAALVGLSRAGFLTAVLAIGASALLFRIGWTKQRADGVRTLSAAWVFAGLAVTIGVLIALFVLFDRVPALSRVTAGGTFEDLRWSLLPTLGEMIRTYWLVGAGFGSFEEVYHIHEPSALMLPSYVNQAHNDWAQLVLEGGLPALGLVGFFGFWVAKGLIDLARGSNGLAGLVFWLTIFGIISFASLTDYPLRAPLFQLVTVWLVCVFAVQRGRASSVR